MGLSNYLAKTNKKMCRYLAPKKADMLPLKMLIEFELIFINTVNASIRYFVLGESWTC